MANEKTERTLTTYHVYEFDALARRHSSIGERLGCLWPLGFVEANGPQQAARKLGGTDRATYLCVAQRSHAVVVLGSEPQPPKVTATLLTDAEAAKALAGATEGIVDDDPHSRRVPDPDELIQKDGVS